MQVTVILRHTAVFMRPTVFLLLLLLSACFRSSPTTHYFILTPLASSMASSVVSPPAVGVNKQVIVVNPVELPLYLNRSQIVTRSGKNHLKFSQLNLWGNNLRENVSHVLLENLSFLLGTDRIFLSSSLSQERPTLRISTLLSQFEPSADGTIVLKARWRIVNSQEGKTLVWRQSNFVSAPMPPENYNAIVASMSALLMQLSQEIAQEASTVVQAKHVTGQNLGGSAPKPPPGGMIPPGPPQ